MKYDSDEKLNYSKYETIVLINYEVRRSVVGGVTELEL